MRFSELLDVVGGMPVFLSSLLRTGDVDAVDLASQLSRWVSAGKLISLRRGVYALPSTYAGRAPHPFEVANLLQRPSYVSLESALSFHGYLPEVVFVTTSVTTGRGGAFATPLGSYDYRHVSTALFWGYRTERVSGVPGIEALVAVPEKALLDLLYLRTGSDAPAFLRQLRLERLEQLDMDVLITMARRIGKPRLMRAVDAVRELARSDAEGWDEL